MPIRIPAVLTNYFVVSLTQSTKFTKDVLHLDTTVPAHTLSNLIVRALYSFDAVVSVADGAIKLTIKKPNNDFIRTVSSTFLGAGIA